MENSTIGDRIKFIRGILSRPEFGKRIGVSQTAVQNYEMKNSIPKGDVLKKITEQFNVSIDWLLTGEGEAYFDVSKKKKYYRSKEKAKEIAEKEEKIQKLKKAFSVGLQPSIWRDSIDKLAIRRDYADSIIEHLKFTPIKELSMEERFMINDFIKDNLIKAEKDIGNKIVVWINTYLTIRDKSDI